MSVGRNEADIRIPQQQRSRDRVESILEAARGLIEEKGSSALKIQEIAKRAEITAGSMYQYFPNKAAILQALAEKYFDQFEDVIQKAVAVTPGDIQSAIKVCHMLLDRFFEMNCNDPVLRDIWLSITADRTLRDMDLQFTRRNAERLFESMKHLFPESRWPVARRNLLMLVNITPPAIRLALSSDGDECSQVLESTRFLAETLIRQCVTRE